MKNRTQSILEEIQGMTLRVDFLDRARTDASDNVFPMLGAEQYAWLKYASEQEKLAINDTPNRIDYLDVGVGSGVKFISAMKFAGAKKVLGIDVSSRAVRFAKENAKRNGVELPTLEIRKERYCKETAPYRSAKVISLNAPYHLYPSEIEEKMPQHARGGVDGQQVFKEQLVIANYHLRNRGIISFHQMCLGRAGKPEFTRYIPHFVEDTSLEYVNVLPPVPTAEFMREVYGTSFVLYQDQMSKRYPQLFLCNGIIRREESPEKRGVVREVERELDTQGETWADRFEIHRMISAHGLN